MTPRRISAEQANLAAWVSMLDAQVKDFRGVVMQLTAADLDTDWSVELLDQWDGVLSMGTQCYNALHDLVYGTHTP